MDKTSEVIMQKIDFAFVSIGAGVLAGGVCLLAGLPHQAAGFGLAAVGGAVIASVMLAIDSLRQKSAEA